MTGCPTTSSLVYDILDMIIPHIVGTVLMLPIFWAFFVWAGMARKPRIPAWARSRGKP